MGTSKVAILSLALSASLVIISNYIQSSLPPSRSRGSYLRPPPDLIHYTLGFHEVVADTFWLRVVQDFDVCGKSDKVNPVNGQNSSGQNVSVCDRSWVYYMINSISELAPRFRMAQATGATLLSVVVNDPKGAELIFEKAVKNFKDDWSIQYRAGYHELFEMKNEAKAIEYFNLAAQNGAPSWLNLLAARLATKQGKGLIAKAILEDYKAMDPNYNENPRFHELEARANSLLEDSSDSVGQTGDDARKPASGTKK